MKFIAKFYIKNLIFFIILFLQSNWALAVKSDDRILNVFSKYIESLKSVAIDFTQSDSRGEIASGKMIISKPNKFRLNYYHPYPLLILGNDYEVIVYDYSLEQTTRIEKKDNIFNFLLVEDSEWRKNFRIDEIIENSSDFLVKLYSQVTDRTISLIFKSDPVRLSQIIIDEPDGNVIEVVLEKITNISNPDKDLFSLPNPDVYGKPKRLDEEGLDAIILLQK
ncbi:MAG: hypothetical protein RLZZ59_236 [Pseudomonadota bacterium]|jgi:outer membrane lipoprotein-sorting protein